MSVPKEQTLTQEELKEVVHYDPETGLFTWLKQCGRQKPGDPAGSRSEKLGYILIGIKGVRHYAHRLAWLYMTGLWPENVIDHDDNDGFNNKFKNLKSVSQRKNIEKAVRKGGRFGVPGVVMYPANLVKKMKKHFHAKIVVNEVTIGLGSFICVKDAYEAYKEAKFKHHGVVLGDFESYGVENVQSIVSI